MKIAKYNNYIQISDLPEEVLNNLSDYESVLVSGNINCCTDNCGELINSYSLPLTETGWNIDLDQAVKLNNFIYTLNIQSIYSQIKYNAITASIDLGYVEANCSSGTCTLEDFTGHFSPLFKTAIDSWFTGIGVSSNVIISFDENILVVEDLPDNYTLVDIGHGLLEAELYIPFGYSDVNGNVFLNEGSIYIKPCFFNSNCVLIDGVYKFTVRWIKVDGAGYLEQSNCSFIDINTKCQVASVLQNILKEQNDLEKCSTIIHILHYALINGSNCGCNCDEMCQVYKELRNLLDTIDPQILNNCGC